MFREFEVYREEIELACIQNCGVECELYSIIGTMIRESRQSANISLRDVTLRRTTEHSERLKGSGGFPDFVVLSRKKQEDADIYGCVEAKAFYKKLDSMTVEKQFKGHIESYDKVIYTNGLKWQLYENKNCEPKREVVLGKFQNNKIEWEDQSKWLELWEMLDNINWKGEGL